MFDTGNPNSFLLNNKYLELNKGENLGTGATGSGQSLELYSDEVKNIRIGHDYQIDSHPVQHADLGFTQIGIHSELMGFLGYEFMKDYEFVIDYDNQMIEMYLIDSAISSTFYEEGEIVVVLDFTTPFMSNIPYVNFDCNGKEITANFDTGNQGILHLNESKRIDFIKERVITEVTSKGMYGQPTDITVYSMNDLSYEGVKLKKIKNLILTDIQGIPITETSEFELGIGYQFLKNYRSVWNFETKKIVLLER